MNKQMLKKLITLSSALLICANMNISFIGEFTDTPNTEQNSECTPLNDDFPFGDDDNF